MGNWSFTATDPKVNWKVLFAIILIGTLLRVHGIVSYGLWGDEQATMQVATGQRYVDVDIINIFTNIQLRATDRFSGVLHSTINDNGNSVLYNVVLHYWLQLFGRSDLAARSLSWILGICLIPVAFRFSRLLTGSLTVAYLTALLVAFHPLLVGYAQEARSYSMALLFSLLSSLFLVQGMFRESGWVRSFLLYSATLVVALLSHYLVVYVLLAQLVVAAIWLRGIGRWKAFGTCLFLASVILGLWFMIGGWEGLQVLHAQNQAHQIQADSYRPGDPPYALPADPRNIATGIVQDWLQVFGNRIQNMGVQIREVGWLLVIPVFLVIGLVVSVRKRHWGEAKPLFMLLVFIGAQTIFAVTASLMAGHCLAFLPQYALFVVPYAMVLLAWSVAEVLGAKGKWRAVGIFACLAYGVICLLGLRITYSNPLGKFPSKNFALEAAKDIGHRYAPGDTVLVRSRMEARSIDIYLSEGSPIVQRIEDSLPVMYRIEKRP